MSNLLNFYDDENPADESPPIELTPSSGEKGENSVHAAESTGDSEEKIEVPRISKRTIKPTQRYNPYAYRRKLKFKKPRNVQNRMGSYLARRLARNKPGPLCGRDWTVKEKSALLKALQTISDPENYDSLASHVITRSSEEVKNYIESRESHIMRNKSYYLDLFNMKEPVQPSASSQWAKLCSYNSNPIMNKALHEVLKLASFEPLSVGEMRMDFSLIYNYLANLVADKQLPDLSPLEACLLWDTISDVYTNQDILKNPECLNHLKKQRNKIKSCCNPAKTNRCRAPANLTETLQRDWLKAYESACEEGIFRNEKVPDSYQTSNQESTSSSTNLQSQEERKRFQAVLELIGASPSDVSSLQSSTNENCSLSTNGTTLKVSNSASTNEDLESLCYCAMNPLSVPAKFLSHRKLVQSCADLNSDELDVSNL